MIQITRSLARQLRAVFRKLATRSMANIAKVSFTADTTGLRIRLHRVEILAEYHLTGEFSPRDFTISLQALADFEGRNDDLVAFDTPDKGIVEARWEDRGVPQIKSYETEEASKLPTFPSLPEAMNPVEGSILKVLAEASLSASQENVRYAISNIQLKGSTGSINATDGKQLLQMAFPLPWQDDVLIPASAVFACKELQNDGAVRLGKSDKHVVLQVGPWTLHFPIDVDGRYPPIDAVVPKQEDAKSHCSFDVEDATFLVEAIDRLPGAGDDDSPVTLDLNGEVCVRAKAGDQQQTVELVLNRSQASGIPQRLNINRNYLARAAELAALNLHIGDPKKPVLFESDFRTFVVMPLEGTTLAPFNSVRIPSTKETASPRRINTVNEEHGNNVSAAIQQSTNGSTGTKGTRTRKLKSTGLLALIEEAEALKSDLREILGRSHRLVIALRRHRKQNRLVQSSLKALKDLQSIGA